MNLFRELCGKFKAFLLCKNLEVTLFLNMLTLPQLTEKKNEQFRVFSIDSIDAWILSYILLSNNINYSIIIELDI